MKRRWLWLSWAGSALAAAFAASIGRADAPAGRYVIGADSVEDTLTGLIWQRSVTGRAQPFAEAQTQCENLAPAGTWRAPSIKELQTLVDYRASSPAIDSTAFPETEAAFYWSSSIMPSATDLFAFAVDFRTGRSAYAARTTPALMRCVR